MCSRICIVFWLFMLVIFGHADAQMSFLDRKSVSVGVKVNANVVGIANQNNYGQNEMDYKINAGFGGGVVLGWHFSPQSSLIAELSYQTHGQKYDDNFKFAHFEKEVGYRLLSMPIMYRRLLSQPTGGYAGVGSESKPRWYLLGGLQIDKLISPEVDWYINDAETDFLTFVLEGGNPNEAEIEALGPPESDDELFSDWDVMFVLGGGFELPMSSQVNFSLELRGGIGLTDLNAKAWRLENNDGIYGASRNSFIGLHAGIHYVFVSQ